MAILHTGQVFIRTAVNSSGIKEMSTAIPIDSVRNTAPQLERNRPCRIQSMRLVCSVLIGSPKAIHGSWELFLPLPHFSLLNPGKLIAVNC